MTFSNIEIFVGDININILETNDNHVTNYLAMMNSLGFQSYINSITRSISKTCLDHLFINQKLNSGILCFESYILEEDITDHSPIMFFVRQRGDPQENLMQSQNHMKSKLNIPKFKLLLQNFDWSIVMNEGNPETATTIFIETYQQLLSNATQIYTFKHKKHKKIKPWISDGIITSIKNRDKMKKKLLQKFSPQLEKEYKEYRNHLTKLIFKQKNQYYQDQIENNKNNMKKLYKIIKDATYENNKNTNTFLNLKNKDNMNFLNSLDASNFCNDYYINIGVEMEKAIPPSVIQQQVHQPVINSIYLIPITKNELINHISTLKNNSSPGYDGVQASIIKQTHLEIINPLLHILNLILEKGKIPSEFKMSIVTPIHKAGTKTSISNYRPISLISNFAKLCEKCIMTRLVNFLKINNVLSKY